MTTWTEEQTTTLIRLVRDEKLVAADIAHHMGVSRNAVIGKIHRLAKQDPALALAASPSLPPSMKRPRAKIERPPNYVPKKRARKHKAVSPPLAPVVQWTPPEARQGEITVLTRKPWMCKWPIGYDDGGRTLFCGETRKKWKSDSNDETCSPYCEEHHGLSYQPAPRSARPKPRPHYAK